MSRYSLICGSGAIFVFLVSCRGMPDGFTGAGGDDSSAFGGYAGAGLKPGHGGSGGAGSSHVTEAAGDGGALASGGDFATSPPSGGGDATAGKTSEAGAGGAGEGGAAASALCAVLPEPACEFSQTEGQSAVVPSGQAVDIAEVDCGGCGHVTVQVYFDGRRCFQRAPGCFEDWLYPHSPEAPPAP